jgi:DNA-binding transcriptional ArsR family regulator
MTTSPLTWDDIGSGWPEQRKTGRQTAMTSNGVFGGLEHEPTDMDRQLEVTPADGEIEDLPETEPQRQKSVDIGLFARFPNRFFSSGMARKIGTSASVLYFAFCENANRNQKPSNTFKASDKALASETGLSPRTIRDARIKLLENGLVSYSRERGQSFTYTLLRQELKWIKLSERPRQKRRPRAMAAVRAKLDP